MWWFKRIDRAYLEREQIAQLQEDVQWLKNTTFELGDGNLRVLFEIELEEDKFAFVLSYPVVFPDAPPQITTQDGTRISGHQYGADGELCLEHRPDNWDESITGAQMIQSAHRLLTGELLRDQDTANEIIDGHSVSVGQASRSAFGRFVLTSADLDALDGLETNFLINAVVGDHMLAKKIVARLKCFGSEEDFGWASPTKFSNRSISTDCLILNRPSQSIGASASAEAILSAIEQSSDRSPAKAQLDDQKKFYFLTSQGDSWSLYWVNLENEKPTAYLFCTILDENTNTRLPETVAEFSSKKVAVVGCGSLGAKIAVQLIRSRINNFLLIDDDIFFEGNVERNEFDLDDVGFHKTDALKSRLSSIDPTVEIESRQIRLGGQESSASTVSAMQQISECDLIVDATADDRAFNILASVAREHRIPIVWGSVFAGGIGGLVARARPNLEPTPLDAKRQIKLWCDSQVDPTPSTSNDNVPYGLINADGTPEIATDSDVSVIASHVSQLALDTMTSPDFSKYPFSAYAVGMIQDWIFSAPFDVRPIAFSNIKAWESNETSASEQEIINFLNKLMPSEEQNAS